MKKSRVIGLKRPWDKRMKRLFWEAPQDYVEWLLPEAHFNSNMSPELENETLYADLLFDIILNGIHILLHIEFQRNRDSKMGERLWEYNLKATRKYKCPVWSVVIYLKDDGKVAKAPLIRELPNGRVVHHFDFEVIRLWEISAKELKQKRLVGLLPLLPLTKGGAQREIIEEAIVELMPAGEEPKSELLTLMYGLASLAFEDETDQEWLIRRFTKMYDILRETRAYQEMTKESREEGRQEGLEEGLEEGRQEGKLEALRQMLLTIAQERFHNAKMTRLTKGQAAIIDDPDVLQGLILKVSLAQTLEEAQKYLLDWPDTNNEHN
jgi:predicted transposase YdaD